MKKEVIQYVDLEQIKKDLKDVFENALSDFEEEERTLITDNVSIDEYIDIKANEINDDMCEYLHLKDHTIMGNFNNIDYDYPYDNGFSKIRVHDFECVRQMVKRLDENQQDERTKADRIYLRDWFWETFGTWGLEYNLKNEFSEILYSLREEE